MNSRFLTGQNGRWVDHSERPELGFLKTCAIKHKVKCHGSRNQSAQESCRGKETEGSCRRSLLLFRWNSSFKWLDRCSPVLLLQVVTYTYVSMFWPAQFGFCLRGHRLFWEHTEAHTAPSISVRGCQVLVNGFCSGLRWSACGAWARPVQQEAEMQSSALQDGGVTPGSLSQTLTAANTTVCVHR